jgi:alkylation response protein AidB-like acyl-CoA dehydrogenase
VDVLPNEQELLIQQAVAKFLEAECPPKLIREVEEDQLGFSQVLWEKFAALGWLGLCLPERHGGQALPLTYLGLVLEEIGRHIAPLPVHATMVPALMLAAHGSAEQQKLLERVVTGNLLLSFAVAEKDGRWAGSSIKLEGTRIGDDVVLSGSKYFVDQFGTSEKCLVAFRLKGDQSAPGELAAILVDTSAAGIRSEQLPSMAKDSESVVTFDAVRVPASNIVGREHQGPAIVQEMMDYATALLVPQIQGAARRAMEFAVDYVNHREAFGQPIGSFQAIQHLAADMVNAVDGTQLLGREAIWRLSEGLPARIEISQAKSFANEKCLMVCRSAQQMHGGLGFIAECDLNLWYRRVTSWGLRGGTTYEHRARIASALLDMPGDVRHGMTLTTPVHVDGALHVDGV